MAPPVAKNSYADCLRKGMANKGYTILALARKVGCVYDRLRKVCNGKAIVSAELNLAICRELGLDTATMWHLAANEKRCPTFGSNFGPPRALRSHAEFVADFNSLTIEQQQQVVSLISSLVLANKAKNDRG